MILIQNAHQRGRGSDAGRAGDGEKEWEKKKKRAAEKGKEDRRETGGEGETNYERTRPQWDKRVRERGRETRERELFPLGL